jgi:hypothetical protein
MYVNNNNMIKIYFNRTYWRIIVINIYRNYLFGIKKAVINN